MEKRELTRRQAKRGFFAATVLFLVIFASTAVPIPLYTTYQETIGLTTADISNTMFAYLVGVAFMLLVAGRVSDALGRKPVALVTVIFAIAGCLMFLFASNAFTVLAARFIQGIAIGLTMSAVSALVVDCASDYRLSFGTVIASCGPMLGLTVGSIGVGVLYAAVPSISVVFGVTIVCLAASATLLPLVPETIAQRASFRSSVKVRFFVPSNARGLFLVTIGLYLATWATNNFFQSFSAPIAFTCFDAQTTVLGSIVLVSAMAPCALGGPLVSRLSAGKALRAGALLFVVSSIALVLTINSGNVWLFLAAVALSSVAVGACTSPALRMLLLAVGPSDTSAIISSVNLAVYVGSAVANLMTGSILGATSFFGVFSALALVSMVAAAVVFAYTRRLEGTAPESKVVRRRKLF